jgi:2-desacetyl-2-hydroxyethyl bacteriochlorophyllide A dehydrogenase
MHVSLPDTMLAAVYRAPQTVAVEEWPTPKIGQREVLLEVSHCGVCGTDLHMVMEGWGRPNSVGGHEYSGHIVALGPDVSGWGIGERVVAQPQAGCGACEHCRAHRPSLCLARSRPGVTEFQGAFAQYVRVHESQLQRVPEGLPLRAAALTEPLAVALHAITLSGVRPGQRVLVTGAGPIGTLAVAALRAAGVDRITVSEPSPVRRALAARLGAAAVDPNELVTPPLPFDVIDDACDVAFECSGHASAVEAALGQLKRGGKLVLVGTGMSRPKLDVNRVLLNELVVTGAYNYDADGFRQALGLLVSGRIPTEVLVEPDDVPLGGMLAAMQRLVAGQIAGKVLVVPREG